MTKTAVIYARVSTSRQADDELPIDSQVNRCLAKADELGAAVAQVFRDEGISGGTDQRPAFQDAIEYCQLMDVDYLITWSTSRFARNKLHAAVYKEKLARAGTEIVYLSTPMDRTTDGGWLMESVLELFDEMASRQIASDTRRSMIRLAEQGYFVGGQPPYGFTPAPVPGEKKRRRLQTVEHEAQVARQMVDWRMAGMGAKLIADELNDRGITNRGRRWAQGSVLYLLRSEALIGRTVFNRKDRRNGKQRPESQWIRVESHEAIVEKEHWEAVQALISDSAPKRHAGSPLSTHFFTGLLRCDCGGTMIIERATGRSKTYSYYTCQAARRGAQCAGRRIPAGQLDDWLLDIIGRRVFSTENLVEICRELHEAAGKWAKDRARRMAAAQRRISDVQARQSKIFDIMETFGRDTPNLGDLTLRLRANKREMQQLEQRIAAIDAEQPPELTISETEVGELRDFLMDRIRDRDDIKRARGFFAEVIDRIDVLDDEIQIRYRPDRLVGADTPAVHSSGKWLPGQGLLRTVCERLPDRWQRAA